MAKNEIVRFSERGKDLVETAKAEMRKDFSHKIINSIKSSIAEASHSAKQIEYFEKRKDYFEARVSAIEAELFTIDKNGMITFDRPELNQPFDDVAKTYQVREVRRDDRTIRTLEEVEK